jgi:hypothetical protein
VSCTSHQFCGLFEHVSYESDYVEASECCSVALVILDQPAAARRPGEGSFHDPASWQQDKSAFCLRQFDDVQRNPLGEAASAYPSGECRGLG